MFAIENWIVFQKQWCMVHLYSVDNGDFYRLLVLSFNGRLASLVCKFSISKCLVLTGFT